MLVVTTTRGLAGRIPFIAFGYNLNPEVAAALESGALQGWIARQPKEVGYQAVATALALIRGETRAPILPIDFVVITPDNLKEPTIQALLNLHADSFTPGPSKRV